MLTKIKQSRNNNNRERKHSNKNNKKRAKTCRLVFVVLVCIVCNDVVLCIVGPFFKFLPYISLSFVRFQSATKKCRKKNIAGLKFDIALKACALFPNALAFFLLLLLLLLYFLALFYSISLD